MAVVLSTRILTQAYSGWLSLLWPLLQRRVLGLLPSVWLTVEGRGEPGLRARSAYQSLSRMLSLASWVVCSHGVKLTRTKVPSGRSVRMARPRGS